MSANGAGSPAGFRRAIPANEPLPYLQLCENLVEARDAGRWYWLHVFPVDGGDTLSHTSGMVGSGIVHGEHRSPDRIHVRGGSTRGLRLAAICRNIAFQLAQRGVLGPISTIIASKNSGAGAQASQIPLSGRLPLSQASLHQAIGQAFVDALHGSFLISGIALLVTALLVLFLFPSKQRVMRTSIESAEELVTTGASAMQHVAAAVDAEERSTSLIA